MSASNGSGNSRPYWTPTQQKILKLLSDGLAHTRQEIHALLPDELSMLRTIRKHISIIRTKLPADQTIVCEIGGKTICYRHVILLTAAIR